MLRLDRGVRVVNDISYEGKLHIGTPPCRTLPGAPQLIGTPLRAIPGIGFPSVLSVLHMAPFVSVND